MNEGRKEGREEGRKEGRNEKAGGGERREGWRRTLKRGRKVGAI